MFRVTVGRWEGWLWVSAVLIVSGIGILLSWCFWGELRGDRDSLSTTVRNVALVIGGVIAVLLAVWRSRIGERQADAAQRQAEITQNQVEIAQSQIEIARSQVQTAQQSLLHERSQKAAEMLGSSVLAVRLGGIDALQGLAEQNPEQYHVPVMKQLCSFVRHPTEVEGQPTVDSSEIELGQFYDASTAQDYAAAGTFEIEEVREDIQAAIDSIASCHTRNRQIETLYNYWIDLHGADLRGVDLSNKDLSKAPEYDEAEPFNYAMIGTMHTNLRGVKLHYANLIRTNLTQTDLSRASGLTQSILDDVYTDPGMPPRLDYAFDAETGQPLVWRGTDINS